MTRNTSISLGDHFGPFIAQQISQGRYGSASEVVRAGLRHLEEHEARLAALRAALADGESSGAATALDMDAFLKAKRQKEINPMHEIICPHCSKAFKIDQAGYADIIK